MQIEPNQQRNKETNQTKQNKTKQSKQKKKNKKQRKKKAKQYRNKTKHDTSRTLVFHHSGGSHTQHTHPTQFPTIDES